MRFVKSFVSVDGNQVILVATNVGSRSADIDIASADMGNKCADLITGEIYRGTTFSVPPRCTVWLTES